MAQVKVNNVTCTVNDDDIEVCHGELDLNESEAWALVVRLSMQLESAEFDQKCYEYFSCITDNCCMNRECDKHK